MALGLSQSEVCERMGILQPQLSRLENGHVENPDMHTLEKLRLALGMAMDEIVRLVNESVARRLRKDHD